MKSLFLTLVASSVMLFACGQGDKSKRPSPPALAKETLASGAVVSIDYSQPSVKGRTIEKTWNQWKEKYGVQAPTKQLLLK
jgi:hypothetical protein